jgi:hypothetical protein
LFAEDATVQTEWGPVLRDRSELMHGLVALFASDKAPSALTNSPVFSRQVTNDVIVSHGTSSRRLGDGPPEDFLYTRVYVRRGAAWVIAANQIARPSPHPKPVGIGEEPA